VPGNVPQLTLAGAKDAEDAALLLHDQDALRSRVFQISGVVLPPITFDPDRKTEEGRWELRMDGEVVSSGTREAPLGNALPMQVLYDLFVHGTMFVTPLAVAQHLNIVSETYPDLVRTVRAVLTLDQLTARLRSRLLAQQPLRDFRGALEDILVKVAEEARP
jgi:type III secretory pathway component EscV